MIGIALISSVVLSTGMITTIFILSNHTYLALIVFFLGVLWLIGLRRTWKGIPFLGLFGMHALAVYGILLDCPPILAAAGAFFSLLAWDLADFSYRLRLAARGDPLSRLIHRHFLIFMLIALAGATLVVFSLKVRMQLTFEWMALLLLFGSWGVIKIVTRLLPRS